MTYICMYIFKYITMFTYVKQHELPSGPHTSKMLVCTSVNRGQSPWFLWIWSYRCLGASWCEFWELNSCPLERAASALHLWAVPTLTNNMNLHLSVCILYYSQNNCWAWRDGSVTKCTHCPCRGPEFRSQHPYGGWQPSVIPGRRDLTFEDSSTHMAHRHKIYTLTHTLPYIKYISSPF